MVLRRHAFLIATSFAPILPLASVEGWAADLAHCRASLASGAEVWESTDCAAEVIREDPLMRSEAEASLEATVRDDPKLGWPLFYLGILRWKDRGASASLFLDAAARFREAGDIAWEIRASYTYFLQEQLLGLGEEAWRSVTDTLRRASQSERPEARIYAALLEAQYKIWKEEDFALVDQKLAEAEQLLTPAVLWKAHRDLYRFQAYVALELGRYERARERFSRVFAVLESDGRNRPYFEASIRPRIVRALLENLSIAPRLGDRAAVMHEVNTALAIATEAGNSQAVAELLWFVGFLGEAGRSSEALSECFEWTSERDLLAYCAATAGRRQATLHPARATDLITQAFQLTADEAGISGLARAHVWREAMHVAFATQPPEIARETAFRALDSIERIRSSQPDPDARAGLFSTWAEDYYWPAGRMLKASTEPGVAPELAAALREDAFAIGERLRARSLNDLVGASPVRLTESLDGGHAELAEMLAEVAQLETGLAIQTPAERPATLAEVGRLQRRIETLAARLPASGVRAAPAFATLAEVANGLAADEAMIAFLVAPDVDLAGDFAGGSWAFTVAGGTIRVHPTLDRTEVRRRVDAANGLLLERRGLEGEAFSALGKDLLGDALASLPPGIGRLIVVPDDALHRLPFAALTMHPGGRRLVEDYELTLAPSATLWRHWREGRSSRAAHAGLVLADPGLPDPRAGERRLARLPSGRRQGQAVKRALGGSARLHQGAEASEAVVRQAPLASFAVLHLLTHSVVDADRPLESAVLLAPGDGEDGRLEIPEIGQLALNDRMVVLSSCQGADGALLRGEGVMSLARAFFVAGARTVVASLWPLRDDEAEALFVRFYRHLREGAAPATALAQAQREARAEGLPTAAWAGLVVLGDASRNPLSPLDGGRRLPWPPVGLACAALALAAAVGATRPRRSFAEVLRERSLALPPS